MAKARRSVLLPAKVDRKVVGNPGERRVASRGKRRDLAQWHGPLPQGGFVRNNNGRAVVPKTKPEKLQLLK